MNRITLDKFDLHARFFLWATACYVVQRREILSEHSYDGLIANSGVMLPRHWPEHHIERRVLLDRFIDARIWDFSADTPPLPDWKANPCSYPTP